MWVAYPSAVTVLSANSLSLHTEPKSVSEGDPSDTLGGIFDGEEDWRIDCKLRSVEGNMLAKIESGSKLSDASFSSMGDSITACPEFIEFVW